MKIFPEEDLFEAVHRQLATKDTLELKIRLVFVCGESGLPFLI